MDYLSLRPGSWTDQTNSQTITSAHLTTNRVHNNLRSFSLVLLGFNATLTAKVISWRSVTNIYVSWLSYTSITQLFFPKPPTILSHASAEVGSEITPERKFASTGDRTHNHLVMSPTHSPLSHPGVATLLSNPNRFAQYVTLARLYPAPRLYPEV